MEETGVNGAFLFTAMLFSLIIVAGGLWVINLIKKPTAMKLDATDNLDAIKSPTNDEADADQPSESDEEVTVATENPQPIDEAYLEKLRSEIKDQVRSEIYQNLNIDIEQNVMGKVASFSHDIRTELNIVIGFAGLVKDTIGMNKDLCPELVKELTDNLDTLLGATYKALKLVSDNIEQSKPGANEINTAVHTVDLVDEIDEVINSLSVNIGSKPLAIHFLPDHSMPTYVEIPEEVLNRVLTNLLSNAIKFTQEGSIIISTQRIKSLPDGYSLLEFSVEDTGLGISPDQLNTLFDKWNQGSLSELEKAMGSGLGLSICKDFVEALGGTIDATSELGKGSRFFFRIPVKGAGIISPTQAQAVRQRPTLEKPPVIAVFDKNEAFVKAISSKLYFIGLDCLAINDESNFNLDSIDILVINEASLKTVDEIESLMDRFGAKHVITMEPVNNKRASDLKQLTDGRDMRVVPYYSTRMHINLCISRILSANTGPEVLSGFVPATIDNTFDNAAALDLEFSADSAKPLQGFTILSVDDNESNQSLNKAILARDGAVIEFAMNGLEAVSAAAEKKFDVILMDLMMPHMDGGQASETIRQEGLNQDSVIIGLTARSSYENNHPQYVENTDAVLLKPFPGNLSERILKIVDQKSPA